MPGLRLADLGSSREQGAVPELRVQGGVLLMRDACAEDLIRVLTEIREEIAFIGNQLNDIRILKERGHDGPEPPSEAGARATSTSDGEGGAGTRGQAQGD